MIIICYSQYRWQKIDVDIVEQQKKKKYTEKFEQQKKLGRYICECPVCNEDYLPSDIVFCENGHMVCIDCIRNRMEVGYNYGSVSRKCCEKNCLNRYSDDQLRLALGEVLFVRFKEVERKILIHIESHEGSLEQCHKCGFPLLFPHSVLRVGVFDNVEQGEREDEACLQEFNTRPVFKCQNPKCKVIFCRGCGKSSHPVGKCPDIIPAETEDSLVRYVIRAMDEALIRRCPNCKWFLFFFIFCFFYM
jgi:hypothetical protein